MCVYVYTRDIASVDFVQALVKFQFTFV